MFLKWLLLILISLIVSTKCLRFQSKTRSSALEQYESYANALIMKLDIPEDTSFASFLFVADEIDFSVFGCSPRDVSLYLKYGSPPVINPDNSKMPVLFKNITRFPLYNVEFKTDKKKNYINITSPEPGSYFAATFLAYSDPKNNAIQQQGLSPKCMPFVDATVYAETTRPTIIAENKTFQVKASNKLYKFYTPEATDYVILSLSSISYSNSDSLSVKVAMHKPPDDSDYLIENETVFPDTTQKDLIFWVQEFTWNYIEYKFNNSDENASLIFHISYFSNRFISLSKRSTSAMKWYQSDRLSSFTSFQQYNLVREIQAESFQFSYQLEQEINSVVPIAINVTNQHFTTLKFMVESTDVGGTLQYVLAFKPRVKSSRALQREPDDHTIIACIRADKIELPTWPSNCIYNNTATLAPLILNKTVDNSTVQIPYPETGVWYATFKLFCGKCEPCSCPQECQEQFTSCLIDCQLKCKLDGNCTGCNEACNEEVLATLGCTGCDCDGPCKRPQQICNSSLVFDLSSHPCIHGECSKNGRCIFMVSSGFVHSTCGCFNNYRGWDCSDDSYATPFYLVVWELVLLVLSNLFFLPSVVIAIRRKYYIEAFTYFAICFFSTFYHACDAGENLISFCIARLNALQFADFFCALLAIWVTLIAIADLPAFWPNLLQFFGAVIIGFFTTLDRRSLWVFAVPAGTGVGIIAISWYFKWKKVRQMFLDRKYAYVFLPVGALVVGVGLTIYTLLQTESNYKYLHSMWHVMMAVAVVILLPRADTFKPRSLI